MSSNPETPDYLRGVQPLSEEMTDLWEESSRRPLVDSEVDALDRAIYAAAERVRRQKERKLGGQ